MTWAVLMGFQRSRDIMEKPSTSQSEVRMSF